MIEIRRRRSAERNGVVCAPPWFRARYYPPHGVAAAVPELVAAADPPGSGVLEGTFGGCLAPEAMKAWHLRKALGSLEQVFDPVDVRMGQTQKTNNKLVSEKRYTLN